MRLYSFIMSGSSNNSIATAPLARLDNIQALRGLAACLVMMSHLFIIEKKYSQDHILPEFLNFGMIGVDIFFVISGFIMVYVSHKWQSSAARHIPEFLFSRISRIYPLYWMVSLPLLGLYILQPDLVFSASVWNEPHLLKSFFLWPDEAFPLLEIAWTLIHEMSFYLIFAVILIAQRHFRPILIMFWAGCITAAGLMGMTPIGPVTMILSHPLTLEFCFGALLAYGLISKAPDEKPRGGWVFIGFSVLIFCLSIFAYQSSGYNNPGMSWPRVASFGVSAGVLLMGAYILEYNKKTAPKWSITLGNWSYALYLTHVLTLSLLGRIWSQFDQPGVWDNVLVLPAIILCTIIIAGFTHKIIEAPLMTAAKKMRHKIFKRHI